MDDYLALVISSQDEILIRTFGNGPFDVINSLVDCDWVDSVISITRIEDNRKWEFTNNLSFKELRELKSKIKDTQHITLALQKLDS
jgi:hypothetical protein